MMILMCVVWGGPSSDGGGNTNVAQKHASSLRERETKDTKQTESDRERTSNRLKTRDEKKVVVDARRLLPSRNNNTKNTHLPFGPFFKVVVVPQKEGRRGKTKTRRRIKKRDQKTLQKKEERGEKI